MQWLSRAIGWVRLVRRRERSCALFREQVGGELLGPDHFNEVFVQDHGFGHGFAVCELDLVHGLAIASKGLLDLFDLLTQERQLLELLDLYLEFDCWGTVQQSF